jgi:hypothetical protein
MSQRLAGKKDAAAEPLVNEAMHALCVPSDYVYAPPAEEDQTTAAPSQL